MNLIRSMSLRKSLVLLATLSVLSACDSKKSDSLSDVNVSQEGKGYDLFLQTADSLLEAMPPTGETELLPEFIHSLEYQYGNVKCNNREINSYIYALIVAKNELHRFILSPPGTGTDVEKHTVKTNPEKQCYDYAHRLYFEYAEGKFLVFPEDFQTRGKFEAIAESSSSEKTTYQCEVYKARQGPAPSDKTPHRWANIKLGAIDKVNNIAMPRSFDEAVAYCRDRGQRLPTARELSVVNFSSYNPAFVREIGEKLDPSAFKFVSPNPFYTNPRCTGQAEEVANFDLMNIMNGGYPDYFYVTPNRDLPSYYYWTSSVFYIGNERHRVVQNGKTQRFNYEIAKSESSGRWITQCVEDVN